MKVLVTGATGKVGVSVATELQRMGAQVRAFVRKEPAPGLLPTGVELAFGDLLDPISVANALVDVDKVFLLNGVVADELTQALIVYGLSRKRGVKHLTYLSVFRVEDFRDVPHFASKLAVEGALRQFGLPFTILRPGYFMQNDAVLRPALTGPGIYPTPIGVQGIAAVDIRDIAEVAALSLTAAGHEGQTYDLVGPDLLSGPKAAEVWGELLGREIRYTGEDFDSWEAQMRQLLPSWSAFDFRVMFQAYFERGFASTNQQVKQLEALLDRPLRTYRSLASEMVSSWNTPHGN